MEKAIELFFSFYYSNGIYNLMFHCTALSDWTTVPNPFGKTCQKW